MMVKNKYFLEHQQIYVYRWYIHVFTELMKQNKIFVNICKWFFKIMCTVSKKQVKSSEGRGVNEQDARYKGSNLILQCDVT